MTDGPDVNLIHTPGGLPADVRLDNLTAVVICNEATAGCCRIELDEDVPGHGKNYCVTCSRYFATPSALQTHSVTKAHKRRLALPLWLP